MGLQFQQLDNDGNGSESGHVRLFQICWFSLEQYSYILMVNYKVNYFGYSVSLNTYVFIHKIVIGGFGNDGK